MSGYTPGPWGIIDDDGDMFVCAFDGDPKMGIIADTIADVTSNRADAHLIAAAPAMLAALRDIENRTYNRSPGSGRYSQQLLDIRTYASEAIAKAEDR